MKRSWICTSVFAFVLLGCTGSGPGPAGCGNAELQDRDAGWAAAAFGKDLDGLMSHYHENAVQLPPGGALIAGRSELRSLFSRLFADPDYSLNWSVEAAEVSLSCDLGYTRGTWTIISRNDEDNLVESTGKYLGLWVKNDAGVWVVLEDIFNLGNSRSVDQ
jgi:ketosteroid isomerase-like protein